MDVCVRSSYFMTAVASSAKAAVAFAALRRNGTRAQSSSTSATEAGRVRTPGCNELKAPGPLLRPEPFDVRG
jgi:hypothetical protein